MHQDLMNYILEFDNECKLEDIKDGYFINDLKRKKMSKLSEIGSRNIYYEEDEGV